MNLDTKMFILLCVGLTVPIGLLLIEYYFRSKEKFVEQLQSKLKGSLNAPSK
jgi:hypothetical protein